MSEHEHKLQPIDWLPRSTGLISVYRPSVGQGLRYEVVTPASLINWKKLGLLSNPRMVVIERR